MKHARHLLLGVLVAIVLVFGGGLASSPGAMADVRLDSRQVDRYLSDYTRRNGLPGASAAVVKDGSPVAETGVGTVDPRTPMDVGSVSKMITAFAVLQLVDQDRVRLDEPVITYLPDFSVDDPRGSAITVRQLLSHTSGLAVTTFVPPADSLRDAALREGELTAEPGTHYSYSNINYWLAARIVEVVSGEEFADYLDRRVFTPLGMDDTQAYGVAPSTTTGFDRGTVTAYGLPLRVPTQLQVVGGAGGVRSTAHDMALWLGMQQRGGVADDGRDCSRRS